MKVTPESKVYVLGVALCISLTICSHYFIDRGGPYFNASLALASIVYLFAIRELFANPRFPRRVVVLGLILAAVWHVAFLKMPSGADDDIHRYVWDGRLQKLGYNPYLVIPNDPGVKELHTPETRNLNNPELPSPYPPGAELFFRAVTSIQESTLALKIAFVVCEIGIVLVLLDLLRRKQRAHLVLVFAWNPLLAIEVAGSGHIDIVGALFLLISVAALERRWRTIAAVGLGLATAVKLLPIVLLPLYWKRVRLRDAALAAAVIGFLYVPFLNHGQIQIGSLGTYLKTFQFNGPVFAIVSRVAPPQLLAGLAVAVGLVTAVWLRRARPDWFLEVFAWPMAATLLCAPVVFPWYLLWLLPFLISTSTLLIILWTISIFFTYFEWHWRALGHPWGPLPGWVMLSEYGSLAIAAALMALRRMNRPTPRHSSAGRSGETI